MVDFTDPLCIYGVYNLTKQGIKCTRYCTTFAGHKHPYTVSLCPYLMFSVISWNSSSSRDVIGCVEQSTLNLSITMVMHYAYFILSAPNLQ